jgi:hypothetical protein
MATISIWRGYRNLNADSDYEIVTFVGSEIGAVRFSDADADIQYRVFRSENESVIIFFLERRDYDCEAEIYEYPNLTAAEKDYAFVLKKAGVI